MARSVQYCVGAGTLWVIRGQEQFAHRRQMHGARPPMARTTCMPERSLKARSI